jgi:methylisocitrate lyase
MKKTTILRNLLQKPGVLIVPPAYDCLSARIVEAVGFGAVLTAPGLVDDAQLGLYNIGLATASEIINCARYIANSVSIPLIVGVDDGYGGALAAYRTTQEVIRAGAAGIYITDRKHLSLAGVPHNLVEVLPRAEYLGKMGAVLEARNKEDKDFIIISRIDAGATMGDDEVIARAKACTALGVDIILPHAIPAGSKYQRKDKDGLRKFYQAMGAPDVMIWCNGLDRGNSKDYEDVGAKLCVPNDSPTAIVKKVLLEKYEELSKTWSGTITDEIANISPSNKPKGKEFWNELEKKYGGK